MAADVEIKFNPDTREGDITLGKGDLIRDNGLVTAVIISLFTDRRANDSDNFDNDDQKGWWGDQVSEVEGDLIGSRLWLLNRSAARENVSILAKEYIFEALEWMIEDGVVAKIDVDTFTFCRQWNKRLGVVIKMHQSDCNTSELQFDDLWKNTPTVK